MRIPGVLEVESLVRREGLTLVASLHHVQTFLLFCVLDGSSHAHAVLGCFVNFIEVLELVDLPKITSDMFSVRYPPVGGVWTVGQGVGGFLVDLVHV